MFSADLPLNFSSKIDAHVLASSSSTASGEVTDRVEVEDRWDHEQCQSLFGLIDLARDIGAALTKPLWIRGVEQIAGVLPVRDLANRNRDDRVTIDQLGDAFTNGLVGVIVLALASEDLGGGIREDRRRPCGRADAALLLEILEDAVLNRYREPIVRSS